MTQQKLMQCATLNNVRYERTQQVMDLLCTWFELSNTCLSKNSYITLQKYHVKILQD